MPNIYVTKDGEVVAQGDPRAVFLAYREGTFLDEARLDSMRPGLAKDVKAAIAGEKKTAKEEPEPEAETEAEAVEEKAAPEPENKSVEAPEENKSSGGRRSRKQE